MTSEIEKRHDPPCAWAKVLIGILAVLLIMMTFVTGRTYSVEATVTANDRALVEVRADIRYMKESLARIEGAVNSARKGP